MLTGSFADPPRPCLRSGSVQLKQAEELAAKYPNTIPIMLDASSKEGHVDSLIQDHDLVIRCGSARSQEVTHVLEFTAALS